ncbi:MAG: HAD-IA family hydrolase [Candidatus Cloacimonetes bacterium]|nr:HAD-IA family hydrolase [Candidatus Cloacimonadota bacterium]MCF7813405.1 HAD-IA family hydrolase [Candidatus Cloacimonadota bacterium]MCF7867470.1 HAD-IA family hydrolase [Candidatus Cloacimonadota bacterium]MCF7883026.1 HAD-IA family hydrolase [Candidatus Cloacimonadota bacterium]
MIDFAKKLSSKYKIFILSNTDEIHFPYIWKTFPSLHIFAQNLMLSYQLGCMKPNLEIYSKALSMHKLKAEECIFIDDKLENMRAAEKFGMTSILHINNKKTFIDVSKHLT